jgi:DNA-binding NtrC family response regulator
MTTKAILLVDDEAILLLSLKQSLKLRFGSTYLYETATNGEEGLERVKALFEEGVDVVLVISDWLMPGMKGDEFLVRMHAQYPIVKLIMLTGNAGESEMASLASNVKLEAFLRKPWNLKKLLSIVATALGDEATDHAN